MLDLSQYSDEELMAIAGVGNAPQKQDLSQVSDEELMAAAGMRGKQSQKAPILNRAANIGAAGADAYTFGLGPKIAAAVGTLPTKATLEVREAITGKEAPSIPDIYKGGVDLYSSFGKQAFKDDPALAIGASLVGGLKGAQKLAGTKAGKNIADWAGRGGIGSRVTKAGALGAASGAVYGAGSADVGEEFSGAKKGAATGAVLSAAMPIAGAAISKLNTKTIIPNSDEIRAAGSKAFQLAEEKGGALNEAVANKFYNKVLNARPQTVEGRIFAGESPIYKIIDQIDTLKNRPMSLRAAQEIDEALGEMAYSTMDNFGKISKEGKRFLDLQGELRNIIEQADESMVYGGKEGFNAIKEARKYWSTSLRMREIEKIIEKAQSREQPVTALKNGFAALLRRGDKLKGYSPKEVAAIQKAAKTGIITDVIKLAGSGLVPIGSAVAGSAGGMVGGAGGFLAGAAVQQGAKAVGVARQMGRANQAAKEVALKSGMVSSEKRIPIPTLREILKLPPAEARKLLEGK